MDLRTEPDTALIVPMSREQYDEIGEVKHAEWWDGICVVTPGGRPHQRYSLRLTQLLLPHVPADFELLYEVGVRTADADFIPDLTVSLIASRVDETDHWLLDPPLLVIEILSPSTRLFDLAVKRERYARHGVHWYWIFDPAAAELVLLRNEDGRYVEVQQLRQPGTTAGPLAVDVDPAEIAR